MEDKKIIEDAELYDAKFRELFSKIGKEYTSDYFSDLTRKRQISLLISSFATILISYKFIVPKELPTSLMSGEISGTTPVEFIAGIVTAYFLLTFIMSVFQDEKEHKFSILAATLMVRELRVLIEGRHEYLLQVKSNLRGDMLEKMQQRQNRYHEKSSEKDSEDSRIDESKNSNLLFIKPKPSSKLVKAVEEYKSSGKELDEIFAKHNSISLEGEAIKMERLAELVQSDRSLPVRFRVFLDKYFPILLGIYAMIVSFFGPNAFADLFNWIKNVF